MSFSNIPYKSVLGRILRFPLQLIPPEATVMILQGRLRGKRWIAGSGVHGYWLGSYEYDKRNYHLQPVLPGTSVTQTDEIVAMHPQVA